MLASPPPFGSKSETVALSVLALQVNAGALLREVVQMGSLLAPLIIDADDHRPVIRHSNAALLRPILRFELNCRRDWSNAAPGGAIDRWFRNRCVNHDSLAVLLVHDVQFAEAQFKVSWPRAFELSSAFSTKSFPIKATDKTPEAISSVSWAH
jgi:hypothetical protein